MHHTVLPRSFTYLSEFYLFFLKEAIIVLTLLQAIDFHYVQYLNQADTTRAKLIEALSKSMIAYEDTATAALEYVPTVSQVLWTCKMQLDAARLDKRL